VSGSKPKVGQRPGSVAAAGRKARVAAAGEERRRAKQRRRVITWSGVTAGVAGVIAVLFVIFQSSSPSSSGAAAFPYQEGSPGAGGTAPAFSLTATKGGDVSLSQFHGKSVLLFFQEGLTCQPCWDQITDLQQHAAQLKAAGIAQVVSITSDPIGAITQKSNDMGLTIPVLSDPNLAVS
jgi:hypothetical protein